MIADVLKKRALFKARLRELLQDRAIIEVDVPLLYPKVCPDRCVEPISLSLHNQKLYLQPSPELNLKKIVADTSLDCYSLNYAYRADLASRMHHPEFLMLELYLVGQRYQEIQKLTTELIELMLGPKKVRTRTYKQVWLESLGTAYDRSGVYFQKILYEADIAFNPTWDSATLEDLIFGTLIQPHLGQHGYIDIIDGFPLHQSALAVLVESDRAARYEVFVGGTEVANGYDELAGGQANAQRFSTWQAERVRDGLDPCDPLDKDFFNAMDRLPPCSGVAIGIDRLIMQALQCIHLKDSIPFYWA